MIDHAGENTGVLQKSWTGFVLVCYMTNQDQRPESGWGFASTDRQRPGGAEIFRS